MAALFDIGGVIEASGYPPDKFRLIGGQMVSLLVKSRSGVNLQQRMSLDADFGAYVPTLRGAKLHERLEARGYRWTAGRYTRSLDDGAEAIIDLLAPAPTSRRKRTRAFDGRELFETQGLADVLNLPGVEFVIHGDDGRRTKLVLPDERGALLVKTHAWLDRFAGKDASDVWRCLELCNDAGVTHQDWPGAYDAARELLRDSLGRDFGRRDGHGATAMIEDLGLREPDVIARQLTRTAALIERVVG